jgi:glycosyltransferase involved in cell wall biosynthesis
MRIAYCTNVRLPSERAHGHQVAQVCDALQKLGHKVTIFAPFRRNTLHEDFWTYYGLAKDIVVRHLGHMDPIASPLFPSVLGLFVMNWMLRRNLARVIDRSSFDVLYTRTPALLVPMLRSGIPTILELHQLPRRSRRSFIHHASACALVVALTSPMRNVLIAWGIPAERVVVEGDGVDISRFREKLSKEAAWQSLRKVFPSLEPVYPGTTIIVGYVGRLKTLGMEKGVDLMLQTLRRLHSKGAYFGFIVGGPKEDTQVYRARAAALSLTEADVCFTGEVPASMVPVTLAACDVLAMPFPDFPHYRLHMSPLKMFEYMAAERPILTSDLPTIRDVLSEETAVFCKPGDVESFVEALEWIRRHRDAAETRAKKARILVERYDWQQRMQRILAALE